MIIAGIAFGVSSMLMAVTLGVLLMAIIRPVRTSADDVPQDEDEGGTTTTDAFLDLLR